MLATDSGGSILSGYSIGGDVRKDVEDEVEGILRVALTRRQQRWASSVDVEDTSSNDKELDLADTWSRWLVMWGAGATNRATRHSSCE